MRKIIIDTDIGVDDAFALRYGSLLFDLIGITTVDGNVPVDAATKNAKFFCKIYNKNIRVYKGASRPLSAKPLPPSFDIHGSDGLGQIYDNPCNPDADNAVNYLIETVKKHPKEITVIAIGPLTNIAIALNLYPQFAEQVKELIIMGGAFGYHDHTGNMSNFAEFNVFKDPDAADLVLSSPAPITIVPLDVTNEVQITAEEIQSTHDEFLINISKFYLDFSIKQKGFNGMAVHDALTIAYLNNPDNFKVIEKPCRVITKGIAVGQTVIPISNARSSNDCFKGLKSHKICIDVDVSAVKQELLKALTI
ncbi:nucleoside hydrolase [Succinatimonas hippei]|uniref:nucleoside hydrolase n=1 Tax=Succinatimonas hippei TaxID=626938 RepID=UPI0023F6EAA1|nr:nucleoside hydrolase [Succinatimonas hippei]